MQARATTSSQHCATDSHYMGFPLAVGGRVKQANSAIHNETARIVCAVSLYHQGLLQLGKNGFSQPQSSLNKSTTVTLTTSDPPGFRASWQKVPDRLIPMFHSLLPSFKKLGEGWGSPENI